MLILERIKFCCFLFSNCVYGWNGLPTLPDYFSTTLVTPTDCQSWNDYDCMKVRLREHPDFHKSCAEGATGYFSCAVKCKSRPESDDCQEYCVDYNSQCVMTTPKPTQTSAHTVDTTTVGHYRRQNLTTTAKDRSNLLTTAQSYAVNPAKYLAPTFAVLILLAVICGFTGTTRLRQLRILLNRRTCSMGQCCSLNSNQVTDGSDLEMHNLKEKRRKEVVYEDDDLEQSSKEEGTRETLIENEDEQIPKELIAEN